MNLRACIAGLTLMYGAGVGAAYAQSVTFDFKGTGEVCTALQSGENYVCDNDRAFTGTVTFELLAPGPSGSDSETDGFAYAWDINGWVQTSFVIHWDDETFVPEPLPGMQTVESQTEVWNDFIPRAEDPFRDRMANILFFSGDTCGVTTSLTRFTTERSWLDSLDFDLTAGLAPGADATNVISFDTTCDPAFAHRYGVIRLTELTPQETSHRVDIDVRPHVQPNSINPRAAGLVPVAVLGSAEFDATQVDPQRTRFGPRRAAPVNDVRIADVNHDGFADAVLRFRIRDAGIRPGQHTVALHGQTFAGERFFGVDRIRTTGH